LGDITSKICHEIGDQVNIFGNQLKQLRESRGLYQKTAASWVSVDPSYWSMLERGRRPPPNNEEFYQKVRIAMDLSDTELSLLTRAGQQVRALGKGASAPSPLAAEICTELHQRIKSLKPSQLRAIRAILQLKP
jgi:transcriptional regulator with XRE-family HTH domain